MPISRIAAATAILVGCAVMAGWLFELKVLKSIVPGLPVMVPNTALAFVLAGLSLWNLRPARRRQQQQERRRRRRGGGRVLAAGWCAVAVIALGGATTVEYALDLDLGIDQLLLRDGSGADAATLPGRMSPHTALSFLLTGVALYCLRPARGRGVQLAQSFAVASGMISLLAIVGYIYSMTALYSITPQTGMAVHTALTFSVLSLGILLHRPDEGPVAVFTSAGAGGAVARPLLAAAVLTPLLLGLLTAIGQRLGVLNQSLASSLLVVGSIVTLSFLVWHAVKLLDRIDARRAAAEQARTQLLRRLVAAQEEERSRLARELHDKMGQHLSALALNLELHRRSIMTTAPDGEQLDRLSELTEKLSQEVRDLAWELRPPELDQLGLKEALACYAEQWSRRSYIPVDFVSTGDTRVRLDPEAETALYRVCQEALTNVSKHAGAAGVTLVLERSAEQTVLVVEDDGRGFDAETFPAETAGRRRLGLLGMKERVEFGGGSLSIESSPETGTTVVARVPARVDDDRTP